MSTQAPVVETIGCAARHAGEGVRAKHCQGAEQASEAERGRHTSSRPSRHQSREMVKTRRVGRQCRAVRVMRCACGCSKWCRAPWPRNGGGKKVAPPLPVRMPNNFAEHVVCDPRKDAEGPSALPPALGRRWLRLGGLKSTMLKKTGRQTHICPNKKCPRVGMTPGHLGSTVWRRKSKLVPPCINHMRVPIWRASSVELKYRANRLILRNFG